MKNPFKKNDVLSKKESSELLETFLPYFDLPGFNALTVIETISNSDMESKKNKEICKQIVYSIIEQHIKIEDAFLNVGLILESEYALLAKADNTEQV